MRDTHKTATICALLGLLFLSLSQVAWADIEDTVEKKFSVHQGGLLAINADLGSIQVNSGAADQVVVKVVRKFDTGSSREVERILADLTLDFSQTGDRVEVVAKYKRDQHLWNRNRLQLRFEVQVPGKFDVDLSTAGGSISIDDLEGNVKSKTSGGSLSFGDIKGPVTGKTSGGSITLKGSQGDAYLSTSGGSISLGDIEGDVDASTSGGSIEIDRAAGSVLAHTSGGSIRARQVMGTIEASTSGGTVRAEITKQPAGPCRLTTSGGSVEVTLPRDVEVEIDAHTSGGRVYTDFPVTVQGEVGKSHLQGTINGGGPILYLRTSGGHITIEKMGDL